MAGQHGLGSDEPGWQRKLESAASTLRAGLSLTEQARELSTIFSWGLEADLGRAVASPGPQAWHAG